MSPRSLAMLLAAAALVPAVAAGAAEPRADEEVVVTAPLEGARIESLQGAAILGRDAIAQRLANTIGEVLSGLPGISATFYGPGASRPIIRGLGDDRIRVLENGVGVIDASSASPDHAVGADPLDARRIEVLRGAAALAYGGNAVGGVINVIDETIPTRRPHRGWQLRGLAAYSTVDEGGQGSLGFAAAAGDVVFNGEFGRRDVGDYETPLGITPNSFVDTRSWAFGGSLVKDWGFAGLGYKRFETAYGLPPEAPGEAGGHIELEQDRYETRGDIRIGDTALKRIDFAFQVSDYTHTEFEGSGEPGTIFNNKGYEGRLELHTALGRGAVTGATGIQFSNTDFEAVGEEAFLTPTRTRDIGFFSVQRWDNESWGLEAGLRIERRDLDNAVFGRRDFTPVSASVGAFARPSTGWFLGVTLARTERAPSNVELFADGPHLATSAYETGDSGLGVETALSLEGTARYASDAYSFEVSLYRVGFDGYIALIPTGDDVELEPGEFLPKYAFIQRDVTFTGGEIAASARLGQVGGFTFSADVAADLVRAEFDAGGDLPRIPPSTITLGLTAETQTITARLELVDSAEQRRVAAFETPTEGSTVLNARLAWRPAFDPDITLLLDAGNLTDALVRVHASFLKAERPRPGRNFRVAILTRY